jgi:uncharacterized membrane-anchored protein
MKLALSVLALAPLALAQEAQPEVGSTETDAQQERSPLDDIDWTIGPASGELARWATVAVPDGWRFAGPKDTRRLMEMMQNPVSMTETGFLAPPEMDWYCVFEFEDSGYVDDEEKDELDADEILESLREGNERGNEERRERGWATLEILGWEVKPHYDEATHNLEWATKGRSTDSGDVINHNTRLLGRHGVMSATLVVDPEALATALPVFKDSLKGFEYKSGERYAEYVSGDKVAEYGLAALVAGGAGVVAAKTGLLGKLWKVLVGAAVLVAGFFKKLFGGGKKETARTRP